MKRVVVDTNILAPLRRSLRDDLGFEVADATAIPVGSNNRLFRLTSSTGQRLLAKFYFRDERNRLGREYGALTFLQARGFGQVPQPYLRNDTLGYGVYSFENGAARAPSGISAAGAAALGRFAAALHRIRPDEPGADFPPAVTAAFSIDERLRQIDERLGAFEAFAADRRAYPRVRAFPAETAPASVVRQLLPRVVGVAPAEARDRRCPFARIRGRRAPLRPWAAACPSPRVRKTAWR